VKQIDKRTRSSGQTAAPACNQNQFQSRSKVNRLKIPHFWAKDFGRKKGKERKEVGGQATSGRPVQHREWRPEAKDGGTARRDQPIPKKHRPPQAWTARPENLTANTVAQGKAQAAMLLKNVTCRDFQDILDNHGIPLETPDNPG
jgi:hypothetical protein